MVAVHKAKTHNSASKGVKGDVIDNRFPFGCRRFKQVEFKTRSYVSHTVVIGCVHDFSLCRTLIYCSSREIYHEERVDCDPEKPPPYESETDNGLLRV